MLNNFLPPSDVLGFINFLVAVAMPVMLLMRQYIKTWGVKKRNAAFKGFTGSSKCIHAPKVLSQEHLEPIAMRQWKTVLGWIAFHPDQVAQLRDTKGQTILHHAALFRAPFQIIDSLLWAAPELASVANQDGELALHWAIRLSIPIPVLRLFLQAYPQGAFCRDTQHASPLSLLWERHQHSLLQNWRSEKEKLLEESNISWRRILTMFRATYEAQQEGSKNPIQHKFLPLHIAASQPCPPCLFPFMIEIYREQLSIKDDSGNLPLSIACASPDSNRTSDVLTKIEMLLREYPAALKISSNGRFPLHVALNSGVQWEEGIETMIRKFPSALTIRDPRTGLFPFALAAIKHETSQKPKRESQLTTIYNVLRSDPSILQSIDFGLH